MTAVICGECRKPIDKTVMAAYNDLYGNYRVDLYNLATEIDKGITALATNLARHPTLYFGVTSSDADIGSDAVESWLGYNIEDCVAAVRHHREEEAVRREG